MFVPIIPEGASKPIAPYVHGSLCGDTLYVAGTLPLDRDGGVVHQGDVAAQTRHVLDQIQAVVRKAGGTLQDIAYNMIFIARAQDYAAMNQVYGEYFPNPPARFCIVSELVKKGCLVEIGSIAHVGRS